MDITVPNIPMIATDMVNNNSNNNTNFFLPNNLSIYRNKLMLLTPNQLGLLQGIVNEKGERMGYYH